MKIAERRVPVAHYSSFRSLLDLNSAAAITRWQAEMDTVLEADPQSLKAQVNKGFTPGFPKLLGKRISGKKPMS